MSRTDKTDPYRVHAARIGTAMHDHRLHECDLDSRVEHASSAERDWRYRWSHCTYVIDGRYSYTLTFYPRTRRVKIYRDKDLGRQRGAERRAQRAALKAARAGEELEDIEFGDGRHRHNALWEVW